MRIKRDKAVMAEGDMTPMIDMTFQLIAFFMVLINFTDSEQARIDLPSSQLAKPPEGQIESPISLQLNKDGEVLFAGEAVKIDGMRPYLLRERDLLQNQGKSPADATVIIRADKDSTGGDVQRLISECQSLNFEHFALRVKEELEFP